MLLLVGELRFHVSVAQIRARQGQTLALEATRYEPTATLTVSGSILSRRSRQSRRQGGRLRERAIPLLLLDGELHWRVSGARIRARQSQASALEAIKYEPMATLAAGGSTLSEALASVEATGGVAVVSEQARCSSWTESCIGVPLALEYARDRAKHRP